MLARIGASKGLSPVNWECLSFVDPDFQHHPGMFGALPHDGSLRLLPDALTAGGCARVHVDRSLVSLNLPSFARLTRSHAEDAAASDIPAG